MPLTVARASNCTSSGHTRVAVCALRPPTHRRSPRCSPPSLSRGEYTFGTKPSPPDEPPPLVWDPVTARRTRHPAPRSTSAKPLPVRPERCVHADGRARETSCGARLALALSSAPMPSADERLQVLRPDTEMCAVALLPRSATRVVLRPGLGSLHSARKVLAAASARIAHCYPRLPLEISEKWGEASAAGSPARSGGGLAVLSVELRVQGYAAVRSPSGFAVRAIA
ncbi:hypothetical protein SCP_1005090 [Sparassis crispa]|uniref:Uncharacterized protein n=1 Tax=Sparassis crispa TaxID=139825 RepID=A0A401GYN0_9APHY|nr:hypothetical protein SCP_1005090 [Sparassis crispa]GBE87262.1 hypothetical protein SCP_1005090 [Sparassis crispa]